MGNEVANQRPAQQGDCGAIRAERDELSMALAATRQEITRLQVERNKANRPRPGPVMTNVLAVFLLIGAFAILVTAAYAYRDLGYVTPFPVWLVLTVASGPAATLIFDNVHRLPQRPRNRALRASIGLGAGFLAWFVASLILRAAVGETTYATGGDVGMMLVSATVGAVTALSLRAMGAAGLRHRIRKK